MIESTTLDRFQSVDPRLLDIAATDNVVDIGCGTGRHVLELAKAPANIIGADISSEDLLKGRYLIEIMRRRREVQARVHWMQAAGEHLPFADGAFDRVICTETLEHVEDDALLARELVRVLKPGGILAISVPDEYSERLFWKLSVNYRTHVGGHVRIYSRPRIVRLMREAGLRPYAVRYRHSLETMYWLGHVAFWSEWGKQGPITSAFRKLLDSPRLRESKLMSALDDIGNRILPKSIVVYSRKPLDEPLAPVTLADETPHEFGVPEHLAPEVDAEAAFREALVAAGELPSANGHGAAREAEEPDDRTAVEVRAVPAPFEIDPNAGGAPAASGPLVLRDELRIALTLEGEAQKQRLVEILRSCRFRFIGEVQELSGEQASTPWTPDGRSMKEIVGHMTGWELWVVTALEEIAAGAAEPGIMSLSGYPVGISRYGSIDAFNAARMAETRERMWSAVLADSDATFERLLAAVERVPASSLRQTAPFFWPDLGGTVPCGVYLLMVSAHHYQEEHLPEVLRGPAAAR
ncbi:MAG: class I SAM-dependent methyltransferase [Dehalococcoidia bacterium]